MNKIITDNSKVNINLLKENELLKKYPPNVFLFTDKETGKQEVFQNLKILSINNNVGLSNLYRIFSTLKLLSYENKKIKVEKKYVINKTADWLAEHTDKNKNGSFVSY